MEGINAKLSRIYKPTSDTFRDSYISKEAAFVCNSQIDLLKKEENLTLTFDGTTIRKQGSLYMAHATTPAWDTYFLDGNEGTGEHHNAEWIMDKLLKVFHYYWMWVTNLNIIIIYLADNFLSRRGKVGCNSFRQYKCYKSSMPTYDWEGTDHPRSTWSSASYPTHNHHTGRI